MFKPDRDIQVSVSGSMIDIYVISSRNTQRELIFCSPPGDLRAKITYIHTIRIV